MNDYFNKSQHAFIRTQRRKKLFYTLRRHACRCNHIEHILPLLARNHLPPAIQRQYLGNMLHLACRHGNIDLVNIFINSDYKKALTVQHISWALLIVHRESRYLGHEEKRIKKSDDCLKIYHLILQALPPQTLSQVFEYMIVDLNRAPLLRQIYQHLNKDKCVSIFKCAVEARLAKTIKWLIPEISYLLSSHEIIHLFAQFPQYQKTFINSLSESKLFNFIIFIKNQSLSVDKSSNSRMDMIINHLSAQQCKALLEKMIELKKFELIELLFQHRQSMKSCLEQLTHHQFIELTITLVINNRLVALQQLCNFQGDINFIKILHQDNKVNVVFELAMSAGYLDLVGFLFCCLLKSVAVIEEKQINGYLSQIFNFMIKHKNHELMIYLLIKMNQMTRGWWQKLMLQLSGEVVGTVKNPLVLIKERMLDKLCIWLSSTHLLVLLLYQNLFIFAGLLLRSLSIKATRSHPKLSTETRNEALPIPRHFPHDFCLSSDIQANDFLKGLHQILRLTITKSLSYSTELFKEVKDKSELPLSALLCWCVYQSRYDLAQQLIHLGADPFYQITPSHSHYNAFHFCLNIDQTYELLSIYINNKRFKKTDPESVILEQEHERLLKVKLQVVGYFRKLEHKTKFLDAFIRPQKPNNREHQLLKSIIQTALKAISIRNLHELLNNAKSKCHKKHATGKHNPSIVAQLDLALKATYQEAKLPEKIT